LQQAASPGFVDARDVFGASMPINSNNGTPMKTKRIFWSLLFALTMLQGCGHSGSGSSSSPTNGSVRLVNASTAVASLDMITSGTTLAKAVATGSGSTAAGLAPGTYTFSLDLSGSGTPLAQQPLLISSGVSYALVAHTGSGQLQLTALTEIEAAPASGDGKIRVSNLALQDTGIVDVYMTGNGGNLANAPLLVTNFSTSGYFEIPQGTYHIWVTGVGNKADLRLDLPSVIISNQQVLTLVLTATTGGVLVDGWLVTQQAAVSAQTNASARIRVAANIAAGGTVAATANGVSLDSSALVSPAVDTYALVPAGALSIVVNGTACVVGNPNAAAGADLTLLVLGTSASPQCSLLSDDNTLPLGGRAKLRLVNGVNGLVGNISLTADANLVAQNVALGTASTAATVATTGNISQLQVNSQGNLPLPPGSPPFDLTLQSQGVYSVFMLGNSAAAVEIVRADR
jgi:Domain of unknown function (DUF4397)